MMSLAWAPRTTSAPPPAGLVAQGAVARELMRRLLDLPDAQLQALAVVATRDMLVLLGEEAALPWADGVRYCAPHASMPGLWLPTHVLPELPLDLAITRLIALGASVPFLLWNAPELVLPLGASEVLNRERLLWLIGEFD